jgi:tRNA pseudouridine38-40 synthase
MTRYRITVEYDGTGLVGWQRQDNGASVQSSIEDAIEKMSGLRVTVTGAGRTDAGVHASGQVAHFDLEKSFAPDKIRDALNHYLHTTSTVILDAAEAEPTFHARFSATGRHYRYRILCRRAPPALARGQVWHVVRQLNSQAMHDAAQCLVGEHDFTTFRAAECQAKSPVKTLDILRVSEWDNEIHIEASARSFLHHQVRSIAGSLKMVGEGKWSADDLKAALEARDRTRCGMVAPAEGLCLMKVDY